MRKPNEKNPEPVLTFGAPRHLANVTVILVEPAVPGNIGSAARAMKTMGLTDLVVVGGPKDFATHQQAIMLGHGAGDVLEKARAVTTWEAKPRTGCTGSSARRIGNVGCSSRRLLKRDRRRRRSPSFPRNIGWGLYLAARKPGCPTRNCAGATILSACRKRRNIRR
jgi:hypothetical protein